MDRFEKRQRAQQIIQQAAKEFEESEIHNLAYDLRVDYKGVYEKMICDWLELTEEKATKENIPPETLDAELLIHLKVSCLKTELNYLKKKEKKS